jgi:hypothetical protein
MRPKRQTVKLACNLLMRCGLPEKLRQPDHRFVLHLAVAARLAISARRALLMAFPRAMRPFRQSSTAALSFPSFVAGDSSISPVAIFITWTAFPITSAGRFAPFLVLGIA